MRGLVRAIWAAAATVGALLYLGKLALAFAASPTVATGLRTLGVFLALYLLFMLEGLQVAGLQIKDQSLEAIERHLASTGRAGTRRRLEAIARIFIETDFDKFVTGRQILVIVMVVSMATLLAALTVPGELFGPAPGPLATAVLALLNAPFFIFVASTFIPSWVSQLLPQFTADNRPLTFIRIPGAKTVLRLSILIDDLELGYPARGILRFIERLGWVPGRQLLPIGRDVFHRNAVRFYGRGKQFQRITIHLGERTRYSEQVHYLFHQRVSELFHKVSLGAAAVGTIRVSAQAPAGIEVGEPAIQESTLEHGFAYAIRVPLKSTASAPATPWSITLHLELETGEDTTVESTHRWVELATNLPLANGEISVHAPAGQVISKPAIEVLDVFHDGDSPVLLGDAGSQWKVHQAETPVVTAKLSYPLVGHCYRLSYGNREQSSVASGPVAVSRLAEPDDAVQSHDVAIDRAGDTAETDRRGAVFLR